MRFIPQIVVWTAGAVGAYALARFVKREYERVNEELEAARMTPVTSKAEREGNPTLRRDPRTGVYRP
ncbi:MAG: hypothetical protein ABW198_00020 [Pseudorhodoplanes sp.]